MYRIETGRTAWKFFRFNNYFFSTGTPTTKQLDDGAPMTYFSGLEDILNMLPKIDIVFLIYRQAK